MFFRITTDKTDLRQGRAQQLRCDRAKRRQALRQEELKQLKSEHADFIKTVVRSVLTTREISVGDINKLIDLRLLEASTGFRHGFYRGECSLLNYNFQDGDVNFCGFIGFDKDDRLISIDERRPERESTFRREGTDDAPVWIEIPLNPFKKKIPSRT